MKTIYMLVSYAYSRNEPERWGKAFREYKAMGLQTLLDSGAFTAYTGNKPIHLGDYMKYLIEYGSTVDEYIMLDVVANQEATMDHWRQMIDAKLKPMGVLTLDMPMSTLDEYLKVNPRVCIAGGATRGCMTWYPQRITAASRYTHGEIRSHALGFTAGAAPLRIPLASFDSASWKSIPLYGGLSYWTYQDGVDAYRGKMEWESLPEGLKRAITDSGVDLDQIMNKGILGRRPGWGWFSFNTAIGMVAWLKYSEQMEEQGRQFFWSCNDLRDIGFIAAAIMCRKGEYGVDWPRFIVESKKAAREGTAVSPWLFGYVREALEHWRST